MPYILLIIAAICVIAIVRTARKNKGSSYESPVIPASEKKFIEPVPDNIPVPEPEPTPPTSNMVLLYSCPATAKHQVCKYCDCENEPYAHTCRVCGQRLN